MAFLRHSSMLGDQYKGFVAAFLMYICRSLAYSRKQLINWKQLIIGKLYTTLSIQGLLLETFFYNTATSTRFISSLFHLSVDDMECQWNTMKHRSAFILL